MMLQEIYDALREKLLGTGVVKHVDLWNHNVEFIEQEDGWSMPAVFIEFTPIKWECTVPGVRYVTEGSVQLHIVQEWSGGGAVFALLDTIHEALRVVDGSSFTELQLEGTSVNHNHEDVVETIESYRYVGYLLFS